MTPHIPALRAGFDDSGSPRWLMRTMQTAGLDRANGFALDLVLLSEGAHRHGTLQALADRRVDVVDADRQALAAAQAAGLPVVAVHPYGRILGSVVLHRDDRAKQPHRAHRLAALRGRRLGVLSVRDKNWTLLVAGCTALAAFDLPAAVTPVLYPNRAALVAALDTGEVDAALVHWHLVPQLTAAGHAVLAELPALADALGAERGYPEGPTTFFVVHEDLAAARPALIACFVAATADAVGRLRDDETAWHALAAEGAIAGIDNGVLRDLRTRWHERIGRFLAAPKFPDCAPRTTRTDTAPPIFQLDPLPRSTPCNPF